MSTIGKIHSVETLGAFEGSGLRYVLCLQGCELRCKYCHNPDTWSKNGGRLADVDEVLKDILKYKDFMKDGGVTISGGEPLLQADFCRELIHELKKYNIHCAIDTSGMTELSKSAPVLSMADLIMLDIKAAKKTLHKEITGFSNSLPKATLQFCEDISKPVWIRHVLVPNYTLKKEPLENLGKYLSQFKCVARVDLLPFHKTGEYKWRQLRLDVPFKKIPEPTDEQIAFARNTLLKYGLPVFAD